MTPSFPNIFNPLSADGTDITVSDCQFRAIVVKRTCPVRFMATSGLRIRIKRETLPIYGEPNTTSKIVRTIRSIARKIT